MCTCERIAVVMARFAFPTPASFDFPATVLVITVIYDISAFELVFGKQTESQEAVQDLSSSYGVWARKLSTGLVEDIVNDGGLGHSRMQGIFEDNKKLFTYKSIQPEEVLREITNEQGRKFKATIEAVKALKKTIEDEYGANAFSSDPGDFRRCCDVDEGGLEIDFRFKRAVNRSSMCYRRGKDALLNATLPLSHSLLETMKTNENRLKNTAAYWQYFGTTEGIFVTYPEKTDTDCDSYENRFRTWYVETATSSRAIDIVIVIDTSKSMHRKHILSLAKEAAKAAIGTLNVGDRVGLVYFSYKALTPVIIDSNFLCMKDELAKATPANKRILQQYIDDVLTFSNGSTQYAPALNKAFDMLQRNPSYNSSQEDTKREKVILFLTDGMPTDSPEKILSSIKERTNDEITILTFGLGKDLDKSAHDLLRNMTSYGQKGAYKHVPDNTNLVYTVASFYENTIFEQNKDKIIITVPYVDYGGIGMATSICLPVYHKSELKGVTCISYSLHELTADVVQYTRESASYAFLIDNAGRLMLHPHLPEPTDFYFLRWDHSPLVMQIETLERSPEMVDVIDSMKRGMSGNKTMNVTFTKSRGVSMKDGVHQTLRRATLVWKQIPSTAFSMCLVVPDGDHLIIVNESGAGFAENFVHHRLDLLTDSDVRKCKHATRRLAAQSNFVVFFSLDAYVDVNYFFCEVVTENTRDAVIRYKLYMEGYDVHSNGLKHDARFFVALSQEILQFWDEKSELEGVVIWKYMAFKNGVFIDYHGHLFSYSYEAKRRPWYRKAIANPGMSAFTTPYLDAAGAGLVLTVSKTLTVNSGKDIVGVMALDLHLEPFKYILNQALPRCEKLNCFLVDTNGFVVYHRDFVGSGDPLTANVDVHIIKKEPHIADALFRDGLLRKNECVDFVEKVSYKTWTLIVTEPYESHIVNSLAFYAARIQDTNVILFVSDIVDSDDLSESKCKCTGSAIDTEHCDANLECQCPCQEPSEFDQCNHVFTAKSNFKPCTQDASNTSFPLSISAEKEAEILATLPPCETIKCERKSTSYCLIFPDCEICGGACANKTTCEDTNLTELTKDTVDSVSALAATLGSVGFLAMLAVTVHLVRKVCKQQSRPSVTHDVTPDASQFDPLGTLDSSSIDASITATDSNSTSSQTTSIVYDNQLESGTNRDMNGCENDAFDEGEITHL